MNSAIKELTIEEEYLQFYADCDDPRYELIGGQILAMVAPSDIHMTIVKNLTSDIDRHMENTKSQCKLFPENRKLEAGKIDKNYVKPDLLVECGTIDKKFSRNPILIIEVLSTNRSLDLGDKFELYKSIDSVLEYVVVEQYVKEVKVFRRRDDWKPTIYKEGDNIHLESIDLNLSIERFYRDIAFSDDGVYLV